MQKKSVLVNLAADYGLYVFWVWVSTVLYCTV